MSRGRCAALLCLALSQAACGRERPPPGRANLHGIAAEVAGAAITVPMVSLAAARRGLAPGAATRLLVEDALSQAGGRARGFDLDPVIVWDSSVILARSLTSRIRRQAEAEGAPKDDELSDVTVVHALVRRSSTGESSGPEIAGNLARSLASARDEADFQRRANAVPHGAVPLVVERVGPFDARGRLADGGQLDPTFAAAALSLRAPGETTLVETSFGWHVVRLVAKEVPTPDVLAERRTEFAACVTELRAGWALKEVLRGRKSRTMLEVLPDAEGKMSEAFARLR